MRIVKWLLLCASFCVILPLSTSQNNNAECPDMEVCFMLDTSGSIIREDPVKRINWHLVLNFTQNIVKMLDVPNLKIGFALIYYANFAKVHIPLNYSITTVLNKIPNTPFLDQNTNTSGAIWRMRQEVFTEADIQRCPDTYRVGMVITDGVSTRQPERVKPEADAAKQAGIRMFAIGVGPEVNESQSELIDIASTPTNQYKYTVKDFVDLQTLFLDLLRTRNDTTATPTTTTTTTIPPTTMTTRETTTFNGILEVQDCVNPVDVAIMIDSSGSVSPADFKRSLVFAQTLVGNLDVASGKVRIGLLTFETTTTLHIRLNEYTNPKELSDAMASIRFVPGRTDTAAAFRFLRDTFFRSENGDRANVANVAIVLTDGDSDDHDATLDGAAYARAAGITVLTIAAGTWIEPHQLNSMSSYPHQSNSFRADNYASLMGFSPILARAACDNLNECSFTSCQNGGTCINRVNTYECRCPDSFRGRNCQFSRRDHADVVFALDESGSIDPIDFYSMLDFVKSLALDLQPSGTGTGIGVVSYSDDVRLRAQLRQYVTGYDVVSGMTFRYRGGTTRTSSALRYVCENMFSRDGDRRNVRNIAVFFTDGASDNQVATLDEARRCREAGVTLLVVSIGNMNQRDAELNGIASDPNGKNIFRVQNYTSFSAVQTDLLDTITNDENECQSNPCTRGTCTDQINTFTCTCPSGFSGMLCDRGCSNKMDLTFLIDMSGSIQRRNVFRVLDFVSGIVQTLDVATDKTRVAAVVFSDVARTEFSLNRYTTKEDVIQAISVIEYNGGKTNTADGLRLVQNMYGDSRTGDRADADNYCIIITDGRSTVNRVQTITAAMATRRRGIRIIVVVVGNDINDVEIYGLASDPKAQMIFGLPSYAAMSQSLNAVSKLFCNDVNECSSRPCQNGGTCVDDLKQFTCSCTDRFTGSRCERECTRQVDIVFVLDISGSVQLQYIRAISLIKKINLGLNHRFSRTRVAFVTYGNTVSTRFYLNTYTNYVDVNNALEVPTVGGATATSEAFRALYTDVFTANRGDRTGVKNVAVVLTDGQARDRTRTRTEAQRARNIGNIEQMFAVGIGSFNLRSELNSIASAPTNQNMMTMTNDGEVDSVANRILDNICA